MACSFHAPYEKIIQFADSNYIGIVGSAAHHLVMHNLIEKHADKINFSDRFSIFESMRQIHPVLKEEYFLNSKDEDDDSTIPSDEKLRQYFRFCIETDEGEYGVGFRLAARAYAKMGIQELLYYVALNHDFPPLS